MIPEEFRCFRIEKIFLCGWFSFFAGCTNRDDNHCIVIDVSDCRSIRTFIFEFYNVNQFSCMYDYWFTFDSWFHLSFFLLIKMASPR